MTTSTTESSGERELEEESFEIRLVRRIARTLDRKPMDLPPLAWEVDVDALASLADSGETAVSFEYEGCEVRIDREGRIDVSVLDAESERSS